MMPNELCSISFLIARSPYTIIQFLIRSFGPPELTSPFLYLFSLLLRAFVFVHNVLVVLAFLLQLTSMPNPLAVHLRSGFAASLLDDFTPVLHAQ